MKYFLFIPFAIIFNYSISQCNYTPPTGDCTNGCTGTLSDNANVNSNDILCYTGMGTINNVNLSGGTIRVCGDLTITNLNINSGTILVTQGAKLSISGDKNLNGNVNIVNHGIFNSSGKITMQNANNVIYNSGSLNIANELNLSSATSYFINATYAEATISELRINQSGSVCLHDMSSLTLNTLTNNVHHGTKFSSNSGMACVYIKTDALLNEEFGDKSEINVCIAQNATVRGPKSWGMSTVHNNCTSCTSILPVTLSAFNATINGNYVILNWTTTQEENSDYFGIERSNDTYHWEEIDKVSASNDSDKSQNYSYKDLNPYLGVSYYRLRMTDVDGYFEYSKIIKVTMFDSKELLVYPNPVQDYLILSGDDMTPNSIKIFDIFGNTHYCNTKIRNEKSAQIDVSDLVPGYYLLKCNNLTFKIIKE